MSGTFCMNGTFTTGNRKVGNVTWQFNPLRSLEKRRGGKRESAT